MAAEISKDTQLHIQYQFESFCRTVIRNERYDYMHQLMRHMERETNFSAMSATNVEDICSPDAYPGEDYIFQVYDYQVPLHNERLIDSLLSFSDEERSILLLYYSLGLKDWEVADLLCTSRSRVERIRNKAFSKLQEKMRR